LAAEHSKLRCLVRHIRYSYCEFKRLI
jgi:hypothetical protein